VREGEGVWEREREGEREEVWVREKERECGRERERGEGVCVRGIVGERRRGSVWEREGDREGDREGVEVEREGHRVCVWDEALDVAKSR